MSAVTHTLVATAGWNSIGAGHYEGSDFVYGTPYIDGLPTPEVSAASDPGPEQGTAWLHTYTNDSGPHYEFGVGIADPYLTGANPPPDSGYLVQVSVSGSMYPFPLVDDPGPSPDPETIGPSVISYDGTEVFSGDWDGSYSGIDGPLANYTVGPTAYAASAMPITPLLDLTGHNTYGNPNYAEQIVLTYTVSITWTDAPTVTPRWYVGVIAAAAESV